MRAQAAIDHILERLDRELPRRLYYHSIEHTRDVLERARVIGEAEGLLPGDQPMELLRVAAAYHDAGFLINNREHERLGCKLVRQDLPRFEFDENQITAICDMIRATKVPQQPNHILERILCDADLDYLGRDDFKPIAHRLFQELKAFHVLDTEDEWNALQVRFLSNHRYWTATNQRQRKPQKLRHLAELQAIVGG